MLRGSGQFSGDDYDLAGVMEGGGDTGVPHAAALLAFADAVIGRDADATADAREALTAAIGAAAVVDAAAVVGGFDAITRIADATGIPLDARVETQSAGWRGPLGIDRFADGKV
ncbi:MAG: hypothetical protein IPK81_00975 [Rhodospirillales bacterium]|nr:hypothetical protein [Rhodospirillales bacterium]QQS12890.1 MAG: hypothetical protein IPK81_00975 [Rhodospirillales bacterium]